MGSVSRIRASRPGLVEQTRAAIEAMTWLEPSDAGMVAVALELAEQIESSEDRAKAAGWMGPHLANVLKSLGGAPAERKALSGKDRDGGRLSLIRAARQRDSETLDEATS